MSEADVFPRGGKRIFSSTDNNKRKHDDNLFAIEKPSKTKKPRVDKPLKTVIDENSFQTALKLHGTLTYNKMQDGMIVLACIRHISNLTVQVEFPGLTYGVVTINKISDAFTKRLTEQLQQNDIKEPYSPTNILKVGQLLPTKLATIEHTEKGYTVQATMNPRDVNSERPHNSFRKGTTIWANVVSELDHGYELTVGVKNCRVFLPHKNVEESTKYAIGQPLFCIIHKAENAIVATTLTVSARKEHLEKIQSEDDLALSDVIPGMKVKFIVEEVTSNGVKGYFFEKCFAYIDQTQFFSKINFERVKEGSTLSAYVLFVEPITKVTYLTMRGLQILPQTNYEIGKSMSCEVQSYVSGGLRLKLGNSDTGFVTNKRLLNTLQRDVDLDLSTVIRKKYPMGSRHQCRILDFNYMQQLHICTFEKKIVNEKLFSVHDLTLGQRVNVRLEKIVFNGFVVKCGQVQGFVPNLHISHNKFSDSIKAKYSVGTTVPARVLNINEGKVLFTLKQGLIESEKCLTKIEDAIPNTQHVGFVVQTKIQGALVAFYGGLKGWISKKVLNAGNDGGHSDPREYFFIGQVVNVWISGIKNEKLQVSLSFPGSKSNKIKVGSIVDALVIGVHGDTVFVKAGKHQVDAVIPAEHLTSSPELAKLFLKTCKVGSEIPNLLCVKKQEIPVLSRRERLAFEKTDSKVGKFRDLKKGTTLRCSFEEKSNLGIYVSTPISDFHDNIFIPKEDIRNFDVDTFVKNQLILTKITNLDYAERKVFLQLEETSEPNINETLDILAQNMEDLNTIIQFGRENKWKLTKYHIGERVKCNLDKTIDGESWITLPNGAKGRVLPHLNNQNVKPGSTVEGVVLDYNFVGDYLEICLRNNIKQNINPTQDSIIKKSMFSSSMTHILIFTKFYALGMLKDHECNRQLVYLPLNFTQRDTKKNKCKILLYRKVANKIVAVPKKQGLDLMEDERLSQEITDSNTEVMDDNEDDGVEENSEPEETTKPDVEICYSDITEDEDVSETEESNEMEVVEITDDSSDDEEVDKKISEPSPARLQSETSHLLSGVNSFYSPGETGTGKDESSSDEETEVKEQTRKKKRLTPAERAEIAKQEEARIAKIEKELADLSNTPQTAEHFDRLLLANPNSSELWLKYMAMHVAATELDKARTVGRRAIETINMSLITEKLNIWIALLNLENMYGTKESFEKLFEDAVKYNDSLEVYLSVIKILATSGKLSEMEEKIKKIRTKEKQSTKMWLEVSQVYYSLGQFREARNLKEAALKSILDKKRQFDLIVRFGIMEFQSGELEQAVANFETILNTYPTKVNIWIIYVDQLIKKRKIEESRKVLERASNQRLPAKSMKSIFQKFVNFEEQHGTSENVEDVKNRAKEYVKSLGVN